MPVADPLPAATLRAPARGRSGVSTVLPFETFLARARAVHGRRYDYTCAREAWRGISERVPIVCSEHGVFVQLPTNHPSGCGCPRCGHARGGEALRLDPLRIAERVRGRFPHYALEPHSYRGSGVPATWRCTRHRVSFRIRPNSLLAGSSIGCPICRASIERQRRVEARRDLNDEVQLDLIARAMGREVAHSYRRWLSGDTLAEIGRRRGVSGEAVRQRLAKARALVGRGMRAS